MFLRFDTLVGHFNRQFLQIVYGGTDGQVPNYIEKPRDLAQADLESEFLAHCQSY